MTVKNLALAYPYEQSRDLFKEENTPRRYLYFQTEQLKIATAVTRQSTRVFYRQNDMMKKIKTKKLDKYSSVKYVLIWRSSGLYDAQSRYIKVQRFRPVMFI